MSELQDCDDCVHAHYVFVASSELKFNVLVRKYTC